jgi:hypothetical protein
MKQRFGVFARFVFAGVFACLVRCQATLFCCAFAQSIPGLENDRGNLPLPTTAGPTQSSMIRLTQPGTVAVPVCQKSTGLGEASVSETSGFTITVHSYNYAAAPERTLAREPIGSSRMRV